ncbi:hypothetical protein P43SY_000537 [Pythium insidiosum]|uniref:Uncharacterized protein n=1 Tax=Pythium insidiosum TaxID=114742 RepID=A0AAD5Q666_PYTIN|nr:hypothetical protein P43SY_000537 [Pythium insidiosum]
MIGPQRRSLLGGEPLRREYSARAVFDQFLDRVVDAFDFQIDESAEVMTKTLTTSDSEPKPRASEDYSSFEDFSAPPAPRPSLTVKSPSFQEKKHAFLTLVNEKLCAWILDSSPDGEKSNPLELGWSTSRLSIGRDSAKPYEDEDRVFHCDDDDMPLECSYAIMTC